MEDRERRKKPVWSLKLLIKRLEKKITHFHLKGVLNTEDVRKHALSMHRKYPTKRQAFKLFEFTFVNITMKSNDFFRLVLVFSSLFWAKSFGLSLT